MTPDFLKQIGSNYIDGMKNTQYNKSEINPQDWEEALQNLIKESGFTPLPEDPGAMWNKALEQLQRESNQQYGTVNKDAYPGVKMTGAETTPSLNSEPKDPKANAFVDALKAAENSIKAGYDKATGKWFPHKSLEGGSDTIGYGIKLGEKPSLNINGTNVDPYKGLTQEQVDALFSQELNAKYAKTRNQFNKAAAPIAGLKFEDLPEKYKHVLVNLVYNTGSLTNSKGDFGWPKLLQAMKRGDDKAVRANMVTSYKDPKKGTVKLTERANQIADAIGLAGNDDEE